MKLAVRRKTSGILPENVVVYDVQLLINVNGTGWVPASEENFPGRRNHCHAAVSFRNWKGHS